MSVLQSLIGGSGLRLLPGLVTSDPYRRVRVKMRRRPKVFCVGMNKTGTTSLARVLEQLGYWMGDQGRAERIAEAWHRHDFSRIIDYCRIYEAYQDVPFSMDFTYQAMDVAFPGSRFILSVRESPEVWLESLIRFHSRKFAEGRHPTIDDLAKATYQSPGWVLNLSRLVFGDGPLYDEDTYTEAYRRHNASIQHYFDGRPDDLLVLNVVDPDALERVCRFLGHPVLEGQFPHLNPSN